MKNRTPLLVAALLISSCGGPSTGPASRVEGTWRAVLESPGGELPFGLRIETGENGRLRGIAINGTEEVPFTSVSVEGETIALAYDHYDSKLSVTVSTDASELRGLWVRQRRDSQDRLVFHASRETGEESRRFGTPLAPTGADGVPDISGEWDVVFTDEDGTSPARAELEMEDTRLRGTFLTPTGDYRYLAGDYQQGTLRLSCFDGAHAFLLHAWVQEDGSLAGDFWSRGSYHATWVAKPTTPASRMPDPFTLTTLENPTGQLSFTFPDLEGRPVSLDDERFAGKAVLVDIFGSWCPNCNDEAPLLVDLYDRYRDRGLEIVGLAYEMTGDRERDALFVKKFADRHGITFPLLLAGTSDKGLASETLPDLSGVLAYPTLIFIGRDGQVEAIHTGFSGPATGDDYTNLKTRYIELIESLL